VIFIAFAQGATDVQIQHMGSANITRAPLSRAVVGRPFATASKGNVIIQCGPVGMAAPFDLKDPENKAY
jgi:hypothetical protein